MSQVEGNRSEAAHRTSHDGDGSQTAVVQHVREERCAEFRQVTARVVEWVGKAVPRPVGNIQMEPTRQRGQDRHPAAGFAKPAVEQDQRWAFAYFDHLGRSHRPLQPAGTSPRNKSGQQAFPGLAQPSIPRWVRPTRYVGRRVLSFEVQYVSASTQDTEGSFAVNYALSPLSQRDTINRDVSPFSHPVFAKWTAWISGSAGNFFVTGQVPFFSLISGNLTAASQEASELTKSRSGIGSRRLSRVAS